MRHPVLERDWLLDDVTVNHIQSCQRCRSGLVCDIDVVAVRARIYEDLIAPPAVHVTASRSPWVFAFVAAAAVLFVIVAGGLLLQGESNSTTVGTDVPPIETSSPRVPEFPEVPPPETPQAPQASGDRPSFDLTFVVATTDGEPVSTGRLVWASLNFYKILKVDNSPQGPSFGYSFYRTRDEMGINDPHDQLVRPGDTGGRISYPPDPAIPWKILTRVLSVQDIWLEITNGVPAPERSQPTHPLAANAFAADGFRLEVSSEGIPVKVERPGYGPFEVSSLEMRPVVSGEVGGNIELPFRYALFLAPESSEYQRPTLEDGIVTFTEYRRAAEAAAACAGVDPEFDEATGLYSLPASTQSVACSSEYFDNVQAAWTSDSFELSENDFTLLHYLVEGDLESVEMYQSEPGEERALADGPGWAISIRERGAGLCISTSAASGPSGLESFSQGCFTRSHMSVPGRLRVDTAYAGPGSQTHGAILGIVEDNARQILITFSKGESVAVPVGDTAELGFRGFGLLFESADLGVPISFEALDSDGNLLLSYRELG